MDSREFKITYDFIRSLEGFRDKAYQCSAGVWTVGSGLTVWSSGQKVKPGDKTTEFADIIEMYLYCEKLWKELKKSLVVQLNANQKTALISFAYNVGTGAVLSSTLLKYINLGYPDDEIKTQFRRWVFVNKKRNNGLINRREKEIKKYFEMN